MLRCGKKILDKSNEASKKYVKLFVRLYESVVKSSIECRARLQSEKGRE
jgi:hypothetical protein